MIRKKVIGKVGDIPPGTRRIIVPWNGAAGIGVFNVGGSFYALRNLCPHRLGPLCSGQLSGRAASTFLPGSDPAAMTNEREGDVIRCPWHLWEFDIKTGQCLVDPRVRVKTYPITVDGDSLVVEGDWDSEYSAPAVGSTGSSAESEP